MAKTLRNVELVLLDKKAASSDTATMLSRYRKPGRVQVRTVTAC